MKIVLAFGTFDRFHEGHVHYLTSAKALGEHLVVAVARDAHVKELKQKTPIRGEEERLAHIASLPYVDEARLSDEVLGAYQILHEVCPDVVALGHDQDALFESIEAYQRAHASHVFPTVVRIEKHKPHL